MKQHRSEIGLALVEGSELRGHVFHARPVLIISSFRRIFRTPSLSSASSKKFAVLSSAAICRQS